jgi:flagellar assembly protein FliH
LGNVLHNVLFSGELLIGGADSAPSVSAHPLLASERKAGHEEGFADGRRAGRADALKDFDTALAALEAAARELVALRDEALIAAGQDVADLAVAVAEKIVRKRAEDDPELAVILVREALKRISDRSRLQIRVHPDCLAPVVAHRAEWLESMGAPGSLEIVPDRRVKPGGAEVVFPEGIVDARLDTQLEEARRLFAERKRDTVPAPGEGGGE